MRALLVLLISATWLAAPVCAAAEPGTVQDARETFDAGNYPMCLQKIALSLRSTPKPIEKERYDLLMLRGECLLKLKQSAGAVAAFDSASNVLKNQGDVASVAAAKALVVLTKASPGLMYKSKNAPGDPGIDIADPAKRAQAMKALYDERNAEVGPSISKALSDTSLVPIQKLLPAAWELYSLEFAAKGEATDTTATLKKLGEHARNLIKAELDRFSSRLDQLNDLANAPTLSSGDAQTISFRGLSSPERDELQQIANNLVPIQRVLEQGRRINRLFGGTGEIWDGLLADCAEAKQTAQETYDRRY